MSALGLDLGGSAIKSVRWDRAGQPVTATAPTPRTGDALGAFAEVVERAGLLADVDTVAISVPGILEGDRGVRSSANLPWLDGIAVADRLEQTWQQPVTLVQDGTATALGEYHRGAGRGARDVVVLALGTGVAGAHVLDGRVLKGAHGQAGEIGHISPTGTGIRCGCGQHGCLETVIGAARLGARWSAAVGAEATARDLFAAVDTDPAAATIAAEAADALGRALLGLVATVDPERIVIGGGVAEGGLVEAAATRLGELATFHQLPEIVRAELGPWAAAWGAWLVAEG